MAVRDYSGPEDLRRMQDLTAECWRLEGPFVIATIGDLPWWMYQHLNKLDEVRIGLVVEGERCVAWGWLWDAANSRVLFSLTHPDRRELLGELLDWSDAKEAHALEHDRSSVKLLESRGYALDESAWMNHMTRSLDDLPEPRVAADYALRAVRGEDDLQARTDIHRAAWEPSKVVAKSYRQVMRAWPYRPDLDWVAVGADGVFAASCLCWLDAENRLAEMEPVGTHPEHRRRGLAAAVCLAALTAAHEAGADTGLVYSVSDSPAEKLYESLGFSIVSRHLTFRKAQ
ncbi:MAG: GNAT family N-acetyltransferase [Actinomycetota bacterium]|nr:GNAT family N-acetyltransferase [Actinomycetota bacterium]